MLLKCTRWMTMLAIFASLTASTLTAGVPQHEQYPNAISEAEMTLWYCKVTYYANGKLQVSYLGGYISEPEARKQFNNWARGLGARAQPQLVRIWSE